MSDARTINKYTTLREKSTGRIGRILSFRIDPEARDVDILVRFEKEPNPVSFTGAGNIIDSFEVVRPGLKEELPGVVNPCSEHNTSINICGHLHPLKKVEDIYTCPNCRIPTTNSTARKCLSCGYVGDWIQPGETETYGGRKGRCPCDHCNHGVGTACYMTKKVP